MPLCHESCQPATSLVVVADDVGWLHAHAVFGFLPVTKLQMSIVIDIHRVVHVARHHVLARGRKESTVYGQLVEVLSEKGSFWFLWSRLVADAAKLAEVPELDLSV